MNGLRAFEAAGRHLNFRAASDELGVTPGAIAQQVRALEKALGATLFERHARGVSFTPAGRAYYRDVSDAFARLREATSRLEPATSKVTLTATPTFASRWLIPNLPEFTERHPGIDLRVLSTERVLSFDNDGVDLAVRQGRPPFGAQFEVELLFRQSVVAVASPDLVAGRTLPLAESELCAFPLLHDAHNLWPEFLAKVGGGVRSGLDRALHFSATGLSVEAASSGQGIALASRFLVARDLDAGRLLQVVPHVLDGIDHFYLLTWTPALHSTSVEAVRRWISARGEAREVAGSPPS